MVEQRVVNVDGVRTFYRQVAGDGPPAVFVHGNPTHSEAWLPFLERMPGPALALDLPGWGYSERPGRDRFDYTMHGLARFVGRFLEALAVDEHALVLDDWGALALIDAQQHPERVSRLVLINAVPLLPGYRWHRVAERVWRRRAIGELANLTTTRAALRLLSAPASPRRGPLPRDFLELIWRGRGPGTWPAVLDLYRSADPDRLAAAGSRLAELRCPALVVWGLADPYIPARFGRAYAERLPGAVLVELDRAGHWPWLDRPEVIDRVVDFTAGRPPKRA
jgi:pimeloyl-ACP methyl ester carboxylesterase